MLMSAPKGGRGIKAPYKSTHVRIPDDIKPQVEQLKQAYFEGLDLDKCVEEQKPLTSNQAVDIAREILKQKKSARVSMQKLLTALFKVDIML